MAQWICPGCEGGFPHPKTETRRMDTDDDFGSTKYEIKVCPWCGQEIGNFDPALARITQL